MNLGKMQMPSGNSTDLARTHRSPRKVLTSVTERRSDMLLTLHPR